MAQEASSLQSFMSGLLEEKSMTSIEIHSDNARQLSASSHGMGFLYGNESSEGDRDHHESQLSRCATLVPMSPSAQARKTKSRWDSKVAEKQLVTPKRSNSPARLTMLNMMDLPSIEDFSLSPSSEAEERKNSYVTIAELFAEVLAILPGDLLMCKSCKPEKIIVL